MRLFFAFFLLPVVFSIECSNLTNEPVEVVLDSGCQKLATYTDYTLRLDQTINQTKWDDFISNLVEIDVDIDITNTLLDKLDFSRVIFKSKRAKIVNNPKLTTIKFMKDCAVKRLEIRENKNWTELDTPDMLSSVTEIIIRANSRLPSFFITNLKLGRKNKTGNDIQPFGECTFSHKVKQYEELRNCHVVTGDLSFSSGITEPAPDDIRLSLIDGNVNLAELKDLQLNFLNGTLVTGIIRRDICNLEKIFGNPVEISSSCETTTLEPDQKGNIDKDVDLVTVLPRVDDVIVQTEGKDSQQKVKPSSEPKSRKIDDDTNPSFSTAHMVIIGAVMLGLMGGLAGLMYCLYWTPGRQKPLPKNPAQHAFEKETEDLARKIHETGYYLYEENARRTGNPQLGKPIENIEEGDLDTDTTAYTEGQSTADPTGPRKKKSIMSFITLRKKKSQGQ